MQLPYSAIEPCVQGNNGADVDVVNISTDPESLEVIPIGLDHGPAEQKRALFARFSAAPDEKLALHAIINEWLTGCYDEEIAVRWLYALQLLQEPHDADCYEVMSHLAFFEFGPVALPEPVSAPVPSVSSSKPFAPAQGGNANG